MVCVAGLFYYKITNIMMVTMMIMMRMAHKSAGKKSLYFLYFSLMDATVQYYKYCMNCMKGCHAFLKGPGNNLMAVAFPAKR